MTPGARLVLATGNEGKMQELRALLPAEFHIVTAGSLGLGIPEETGSTFEENARLKAVTISNLVPDLVVADDSGLTVDALNGEPGVHSARYAGQPADDRANIGRLLAELCEKPDRDRAARFISVICLARSGVVLATSRGEVTGWIADTPRGESGFGYDPVFLTAGGRSMAELTPDQKNRISHRGVALQQQIPILLDHLPSCALTGDRL